MKRRRILSWLAIFFVGCLICQPSNALQYQIKTTSVDVATTATALPTSALVGRVYILITNNDTSKSVYIGPSTVATSGSNIGTVIKPNGGWYYAEYESNVALYGATTSGTANVTVEEGK